MISFCSVFRCGYLTKTVYHAHVRLSISIHPKTPDSRMTVCTDPVRGRTAAPVSTIPIPPVLPPAFFRRRCIDDPRSGIKTHFHHRVRIIARNPGALFTKVPGMFFILRHVSKTNGIEIQRKPGIMPGFRFSKKCVLRRRKCRGC